MNCKEYLSQMWELRKTARRLEDKIQMMEAQATRVTASLTGMPRGGGSADGVTVVDALLDVKEDYARALVRTVAKQKELEAFIDAMPHYLPKEKMVLRLRYIDLLSWEQIMIELDYSMRRVHQLHRVGLDAARELYYKQMA